MLRPATTSDLEPLLALTRHPDVARALAGNAAPALAAALAADDGGEVLVIERTGAFVGGVRWTLANARNRIAEIRTLMLDPAARGNGLATAALRALAARLFAEHGVHRIEAEVLAYNSGAQRVFERAGFVREGVRRQAWNRDGEWQDGVRFGLLAEEAGRLWVRAESLAESR